MSVRTWVFESRVIKVLVFFVLNQVLDKIYYAQ